MNLSNKIRSVLIGILILVAYGVLVSEFTDSRITVMFADVISGLAVIGISVLLFPLVHHVGKITSNSYISLKFVEGGLMIVGGIMILNEANDGIRELIYNGIHLYVFIISGFLFYYLLHKSRLIPAFIVYWGYAAIGALTLTTVLNIAQVAYPAALEYLLVLIITNEVFLAIWLMGKGLKVEGEDKQPVVS